jgi:hypothetical protein
MIHQFCLPLVESQGNKTQSNTLRASLGDKRTNLVALLLAGGRFRVNERRPDEEGNDWKIGRKQERTEPRTVVSYGLTVHAFFILVPIVSTCRPLIFRETKV